MLVKLSSRGLIALGAVSSRPFVGRVAVDVSNEDRRSECVLFLTDIAQDQPEGFRAYLTRDRGTVVAHPDTFLLSADQPSPVEGDVIRIDPRRGELSSLYRRHANANTLLLTERCDQFCVMCSQPPKDRDDNWIADELLSTIPLIPKDAREIGITGGEPTLLGDRFFAILRCLRDELPNTAVHVLSHGRRFSDLGFTRDLASIDHPDLMVGIPLYSDLPEDHDHIVQSRGAFDEAVRGVLALKRAGVRVELRFVLHTGTYARVVDYARFVARNLTFVDHVALMGLEPVGFAKTNLDQLWIDPLDYRHLLAEATHTLHRAGMAVSIYNLSLCAIDSSLFPFARKSISDWKNIYLAECEGCAAREACSGFFASAASRHSRGVMPFATFESPTSTTTFPPTRPR